MTPTLAAPALRWTILTPGLRRPAGGLIAVYEYANALAASAGNLVRIVHMPSHEARFTSVAQIPWFTFHPSVEHEFPASLDPSLLPDADVLMYTVKTVAIAIDPRSDPIGHELVHHVQGPATRAGAPLLFVQALAVFPLAAELLALQGVGPKVCVARWLADNLVRAGLPSDEVHHVRNGLHHETFRVTAPPPSRRPGVAMNYNPHPMKNMPEALAALERISRELHVPVTLFGTASPPLEPDSKLRFVRSLDQGSLAETVYNVASIYLQPSTQEGYGLCATEAMACGCALVTTVNGGSLEYAIDDDTAVVCGTRADEMFDVVAALLEDDPRRLRIAERGAEHVQDLRWESSASQMRRVAIDYLARPAASRRGEPVELDASVVAFAGAPSAT